VIGQGRRTQELRQDRLQPIRPKPDNPIKRDATCPPIHHPVVKLPLPVRKPPIHIQKRTDLPLASRAKFSLIRLMVGNAPFVIPPESARNDNRSPRSLLVHTSMTAFSPR